MTKKLLGFSSIFIFILLFAAPSNAGLNDFDYRIIKIAFINGYVRALQSDLERIKFVKNNMRELKEYVNLEAENYMREVSRLNSDMKEVNADKEINSVAQSYNPTRWW